MKKIIRIFAVVSVTTAFCRLFGAGIENIDFIRDPELQGSKIPIYSQNRLQFVLFATQARQHGTLINNHLAVLELLKRQIDPDDIGDSWRIKAYPMESKLTDIVEFWRPRLSYSEGVVLTDNCRYDQPNNRCFGEEEVYFRHPLLDLNGIGFEADFKKQVIKVNADIRVIIRHGDNDVPAIIEGRQSLPEKYNAISATGDNLRLDLKRKEITLVGNVKVLEQHGEMTCDRLSIFLADETKDRNGNPDYGDISGIKRILASGSVRVCKQGDENGDRVEAEELICNPAENTIEFTGDEERPQIMLKDGTRISGRSIKIYRLENRAIISGRCEITQPEGGDLSGDTGIFDRGNNEYELAGNTILKDKGRILTCHRARAFAKNKRGINDKKLTKSLLGAEQLTVGFTGGFDLERTVFMGNVKITDPKYFFFCEELRLMFGARGNSPELVEGFDNVKILSREVRPDGGKSSEINSNYVRYAAAKELISFQKNVKLLHAKSETTCQKLELFLTAAQTGKKSGKLSTDSVLSDFGTNRTLQRVEASEQVVMVDPRSTLKTDFLTVFLQRSAAGSMELKSARAEGNVRMTAEETDKKPADNLDVSSKLLFAKGQRILTSQLAEMDFIHNNAEFHRDVKITCDDTKLSCRNMYVYGRPLAAGTAKTTVEDPDRDPYMELGKLDDIPSRIMIGDKYELERTEFRDDVVFSRRNPEDGSEQMAGGEQADYLVAEQQAVIRSEAPARAWLVGSGVRQECQKVIYELSSGTFRSRGVYMTAPVKTK